ncbi:biotin synthase [Corynebacterium pollutisoli]|uniref:Biotin synthase n=1 Tax=Corynebacterium pollutisoli TaxID=1610489 RepID=A0A1X7IQ62_9CORY|nr:biotin synthase BioB [Corynebacterium pollutisoli]NLP39694.1 biotin synthase BioB [Corynebacterium pollutisoli]SMG17207.1 biotin synthase [Corynebacterium pollutisoli]HJD78995.1 biotin synthase BioB [Corynebacterium pollutisoli]
MTPDILTRARETALDKGEGLTEPELLEILELDDTHLPELLDLAHQVRLRWCGEEVEIEGIISLKTGGCPEDCHFCSQSGLFESPVRAVQLDIAELVEAAKQTQKSGATEFCIVAAVKGPDERLMVQLEEAVAAVYAEVDIHVSVSVGILTREQVERLKAAGVKRYNHNLESARSFFPRVATTHTWDERHRTLEMIRDAGIEVCTGGILGMGETLAQRAEFAVQLAAFAPEEVPINFLDPRPGTPFANRPLIDAAEALKATAMLRLAMPKATLRFGGGRELTLGDLGVEKGLQGGANALIVGNYLTTLGRPMEKDVDMLEGLRIPIKAVGQVI